MLVLINCGSKKTSKDYIWRLYKSDYFKKQLTTGMLIGKPAILSAKHGYVPVTERVEPYNENLNDKKQYEIDSWAISVINDMPDDTEEVLFLSSKVYREKLMKMLEEKGVEVHCPYESESINGIGDQIGWCKQTAEEIASGGEVTEEILKGENYG